MTQDSSKVKVEGEVNVQPKLRVVRRGIDWIDAHPRVGWYVAATTTLNLVFNLVDVVFR